MNSVKLYRIANWFYKNKIPVLPKIINYVIFLLYNSIIPYTSVIGKNSRLNYGGIGVVLHKNAEIGDNVIIGTNVTVGGNFIGYKPKIGDNVYISTGAKILGAKVGNYVIIGANSVVLHDVPDNSVVAGAPAKVIRYITNEERIYLDSIAKHN